MQNWLVVLTVAGFLSMGLRADEKPAKEKADPPKKPATKLQIGDKAPVLKATKWLQGKEVEGFEDGKVYVVEFWATWCGPCIVMMPHLGDLQAEFKSRGVTIIGFSAKDPNNSEEKVQAFVKKRGEKLGYTFAYAEDRDTYKAWMNAAGQGGIPCSFVVDKAGKIAYIGHPMFLDVVLPKLVEGTWQGKESMAEVAKVEKEVDEVFESLGGKDPEKTLKALAAFEEKNPAMAAIPYFIGPKLVALVKAGQERRSAAVEAIKMAETVLAKAVARQDANTMRTVSMSLLSGKGKEDPALQALSLKAAEAMLKAAGEKDALALFTLAEAHFAKGDKSKAKELGQKAIENADNPGLKRALEQRVKTFEDAEKKDGTEK